MSFPTWFLARTPCKWLVCVGVRLDFAKKATPPEELIQKKGPYETSEMLENIWISWGTLYIYIYISQSWAIIWRETLEIHLSITDFTFWGVPYGWDSWRSWVTRKLEKRCLGELWRWWTYYDKNIDLMVEWEKTFDYFSNLFLNCDFKKACPQKNLLRLHVQNMF